MDTIGRDHLGAPEYVDKRKPWNLGTSGARNVSPVKFEEISQSFPGAEYI